MKIAYKHIVNFIPSKPTIDEVSNKLFQLGHEHEIDNDIFDMEFTPNRGDCLSINGLLRDLSVFYKISFSNKTYVKTLNELDIDFENLAPKACPYISFLKIDLDGDIKEYKGELRDYFQDLDINKNNFFSDVSNYLAYETGQPTHCYDAEKITDKLSLDIIKQDQEFDTLLGKKIELIDTNLVFVHNKNIINLAGVMGGMTTKCSNDTRSVLVECAYFNPENIISKSVKYDLKSDSAYKFERGVDPKCHEKVLRRFIHIVEQHSSIKEVSLFHKNYQEFKTTYIPFSANNINNILGTFEADNDIKSILLKLGFDIKDDLIQVPSHRHDIKTENDIAEEIARVIGYDNISTQKLKIPRVNNKKSINASAHEIAIKNALINQGYFEVINNPFIEEKTTNSVSVDNPLDSKRAFLRTNLKNSLIENLLYNERRQKDSVKLFEISDIYALSKENQIKSEKKIGIICSGRVGKNYLEFSKKLDQKYLLSILSDFAIQEEFMPEVINRDKLDTKITNEIIYVELPLEALNKKIKDSEIPEYKAQTFSFQKYNKISEYPCSIRDLSFSVVKVEKYLELQELILNYKNDLIKEIYIFDFYINKKNHDIKIGFRFIFQSKDSTITESQVNEVIKNITNDSLKIETIKIPGLNQ